jgi:hypothetical protein
VEALDFILNTLRAFALKLIRRQPATFADLVNNEYLPGAPLQPDPEENPENVPECCECGCCVAMPTQLENKCCAQTRQPQLVLDGNVLDLAMHYRAGKTFLVLNNVRNNENVHHAAYRQYVLWQHEKIRKWEQENDSKLLCYSNTQSISLLQMGYTLHGYQPARL